MSLPTIKERIDTFFRLHAGQHISDNLHRRTLEVMVTDTTLCERHRLIAVLEELKAKHKSTKGVDRALNEAIQALRPGNPI